MTATFKKICEPRPCRPLAGGGTSPASPDSALCLVYIRQGSWLVSRQGGGAGRRAEAGSFVLFSPGTPVPQAGGGSTALAIAFAGEAPARLAAGFELPLIRRAETCPGAQEMFLRLSDGLDMLHPAETSALAYSLLCRLAAEETTKYPPLVQAALGEIREHYAQVYGVEELAASLAVSKHHLIRLFSAHVGTTPGRYLTGVRIENAKRLLQQEMLTLAAVASLCGFSGADYFCKVFKKETGETPQNWRRRAVPGGMFSARKQWENQLYL